jgi:hypothetical protein
LVPRHFIARIPFPVRFTYFPMPFDRDFRPSAAYVPNIT